MVPAHLRTLQMARPSLLQQPQFAPFYRRRRNRRRSIVNVN